MENLNEMLPLVMQGAIIITAIVRLTIIIVRKFIGVFNNLLDINHYSRSTTRSAGNQYTRSVNTSANSNTRHSSVRNETGPVVYFANNPHGSSDKKYMFNYKKVDGSWRAYILRMPSLRGRDPSGLVTHRLFDNDEPYVCWDSDVDTLKGIQAISKVWADNIQEYIATGKTFG